MYFSECFASSGLTSSPTLDEQVKNPAIERLISYRSSKTLTDLKIKLGDQEFHAHKIIMMEASPVWKAMLSEPLLEEDVLELDKKYFDCEHFDDLLNFFYSAKIKLTSNNAKSFLVAGHFLNDSALISLCEKFFIQILSPQNAGEFYELSSLYELKELKKKCLSTMISKPYNFQLDMKILGFNVETMKKVVNDMRASQTFTAPCYISGRLQPVNQSTIRQSIPTSLPSSNNTGKRSYSSMSAETTSYSPPFPVSTQTNSVSASTPMTSVSVRPVSTPKDPISLPAPTYMTIFPSEETNRKLFNMVMGWIEHEPQTRSIHLASFLELIPLKKLSIDFLKTDVAKRSLIRNSHPCCIEIIDAFIQNNSS